MFEHEHDHSGLKPELEPIAGPWLVCARLGHLCCAVGFPKPDRAPPPWLTGMGGERTFPRDDVRLPVGRSRRRVHVSAGQEHLLVSEFNRCAPPMCPRHIRKAI